MALITSLIAADGLLLGAPATTTMRAAPAIMTEVGSTSSVPTVTLVSLTLTWSCAQPPLFYAIRHEIKRGKADEFWGMAADMDMEAVAASQHESGIFNHNFLPAEDGPILCLWECKEETSPREMQKFIDGLFGKQLKNTPFKILPGAVTPISAWPTAPAMPVANPESTGDFFWVVSAER